MRRARILFCFRDLVDREKQRLAALISSEHGKVLDDAEGELVRGLEVDTKLKTVTSRWPGTSSLGAEFAMPTAK